MSMAMLTIWHALIDILHLGVIIRLCIRFKRSDADGNYNVSIENKYRNSCSESG